MILPSETRGEIVRALRMLHTERETLPPKKRDKNIPL
jgi:propionyl-CoA carboxylase beta chain